MFTFRNLFPCGDSMVCIIDDREDVWKFAPNLITVKKYVYFQGIGDIHAPSAPREPPARKRGGWSPAIGECASLGPVSAGCCSFGAPFGFVRLLVFRVGG